MDRRVPIFNNLNMLLVFFGLGFLGMTLFLYGWAAALEALFAIFLGMGIAAVVIASGVLDRV